MSPVLEEAQDGGVMKLFDFLKESKKIYNLGGKIPKGALLNVLSSEQEKQCFQRQLPVKRMSFLFNSGSIFVEMFVVG